MQQSTQNSQNDSLILSVIVIAILGALTVLGGVPSENLSIFWVAATVTIGLTAGIGVVGWYLLYRPLPAGYKVIESPLVTGTVRHLMGLLMVLGLVNIGLGSAWDEIWHSKYGLPFGEDFFWRPHQMIYFGFIVTILVAAYSLFIIMTRAKGTFQQRFRTDKVLGLGVLTGAYLAYALPADPIWHTFYGEDIVAWSLPHIVLIVLIIVMSFTALAMQRSVDIKRQWAMITQANIQDIFSVLVGSSLLLAVLVIMSSEWYVIAQFQTAESSALLSSRPEWLFVALMALSTSFVVGLVLHATHRVGMATLVVIVSVLGRLFVEQLIGTPYTGLLIFTVVAPVAIAIDIVYAYAVRKGQEPVWWQAALMAGLLTGVISLFVINQYFIYPLVTPMSSITMILASIITTAIGLRVAMIVSGVFRDVEGLAVSEQTEQSAIPKWLDGVIYAGFGIFALFLILTAIPPI